jgi:hypothetical protein
MYISSIQVLVGTNDITDIIEFDGNFNIQAVLTKEKGQFVFSIKAPLAPILPTNMPQIGDEIFVNYTIGADTELIFGGTIVTIEPIVQGGVLLVYQMTAADWGFLFDSKVVKANYAGMDPQDIVIDLIAEFCPPGFTTNHVERGNFLVSTIQFNYQQPTKCLEALAKQIGWDWYIDPNKDVHFYFAEGNAATSSEATEAPIIIDDTTGDIDWPTLDVQIDITNMKNSIFVVGGSYAKFFILDPNPNATPPEYAPVDIYTSEAGTFVYPLAYPYAISTMTVTIDGVGQAIGDDQQGNPSDFQVLYNDAGRFIRFTTDPGGGHQIMVQGQARIPILAHVSDNASIAIFGELQDAIMDSTILSVQEAQERAQAEIDMFGDPVHTVKFTTTSPFTNRLSIGQQITLNSVKFGIPNKALIIKQLNFVAKTPTQLAAQVQCLGSDSVSFNDIMLTLLQQSLANTNTPDSTVLQELLPIDEALSLTDTVTIIGTAGPYVWAPAPGAVQSAEGGAAYGSFGYGSVSYGGGLPYADDAPVNTPSPIIKWSFFTW